MSGRSIRIKSAEDLFEALNSSDPGVRIPVLRAIAAGPEKAASYGNCRGDDLVGELARQAYDMPPSDLKTHLLFALSKFRDPRALNVFKRQIAVASDPDAIRLAGSYLSSEPEEHTRDILPGLLIQERSAFLARVAAGAMAGWKTLSVGEAIRVAIVAVPEGPVPPPLGKETEGDWIKELEGPYKDCARALLEQQGTPAFLHLRARWDSLSQGLKTWLIAWGTVAQKAYAIELIIKALEEGPDSLRLAALKSAAGMEEAMPLLAPVATRFLESEDPAVRLAALMTGAKPGDLRSALSRETDPAVRVVLLQRAPEEPAGESIPLLLEHLSDNDLRVRSACVDALVSLGSCAVEPLRILFEQGLEAHLQVAVVQALQRLGDERWLDEKMETAAAE